MAVNSRKKDDHRSSNGHSARVKLRWMELDVEGGTSDLVEGFRSFATALTRGTSAAAPTRALIGPKPAGDTSTTVIEPPVASEEDRDVADPDASDIAEAEITDEV